MKALLFVIYILFTNNNEMILKFVYLQVFFFIAAKLRIAVKLKNTYDTNWQHAEIKIQSICVVQGALNMNWLASSCRWRIQAFLKAER